MSIDPTATTDIVVIGYGPTGAVLANLLGLRGWTVEVFEREREPLRAPRAVHFDAEVMRVFQQAGVAGQLDAAVVPVKGMHFLNADGTTIFRFDAIAGDGPLGWPQGFMFHQPDLEHVLRTNAARHASVTVHLGHEVQAVDHTGDAGHAVVSVNGPAGPRTVRARYVVGCCGARSLTRAAIGGELTDFGFTQDWLVLDVLLRRAVDLPVVTVQYCDPARPSSYVAMPGARRRFELMMMPGDTADAVLEPGFLATLLGRWLHPDDYTVERVAVYAFHALIAARWRRGRLLIAGDAAHQMPPFLGQGMCAGVRDAADLAWKLDLVLKGTATPSLLDTYQSERLPQVRAVVEDDILMGSIIQTTDPERARHRDARATSSGSATPIAPKFYPIGADLCLSDPASRLPFPQPRMADGRLHDEVLGDGFVLVGPVRPSPAAAAILARLGTVLIDHPAPAIADWLASHGAPAALLRPDRIVLALIADASALDAALSPVASHLSAPAEAPR